MAAYLAYLRAPAGVVDSSLAPHMASLLYERCRIDDATDREALDVAMSLNVAAATIPGPGPRLVVVKGQQVGSQYELTGRLRAGQADDNEIVIPDPALAPHCFGVAAEESDSTESLRTFSLVIQDTRNPVKVNGVTVQQRRQLVDNDRIQCGNTALIFYEKPRPLNRLFDWPDLHLGVGYLRKGAYQAAAQRLEKAMDAMPDSAEAVWFLGRTHEALGDLQHAVSDYDEAIDLDSRHHGAHHSKGLALLNVAVGLSEDEPTRPEQLEAAIKHLERATTLAPEHHEYFLNLARAYAGKGDFGAAIKATANAASK